MASLIFYAMQKKFFYLSLIVTILILCPLEIYGGNRGDKFYAVQTISSQGCVSGGSPSELEFEWRGRFPVAKPYINGDEVLDKRLIGYYWPELDKLIDSIRETQDEEDEGTFLVSENGCYLYYINTTNGIANTFFFLNPGVPSSLLLRTIYSMDPSKKNSGASINFGNINPQLDDNSETRESYSSPNSSRSSQKANCSICHGTGYDPTPYTHSASADSYHNTVGYSCPYCGRSTDHYHYRCRH